jgi:ABC-type multidrug transport system permease subunit
MVSGFAIGWRWHTGIPELLAGVALLLVFALAMSSIGVWLGLRAASVEVAQQISFTVLFPITFVSNVFVPPSTLPDWLQPVAEWNPVSTLTAATRELWGNPNPYVGTGLPAEQPILVTLVVVAAIVAITLPLGVRRYRNLSR